MGAVQSFFGKSESHSYSSSSGLNPTPKKNYAPDSRSSVPTRSYAATAGGNTTSHSSGGVNAVSTKFHASSMSRSASIKCHATGMGISPPTKTHATGIKRSVSTKSHASGLGRSASTKSRREASTYCKAATTKSYAAPAINSASKRCHASGIGDNSSHIVRYAAAGGGMVVISEPINPWRVLGLHSSDVSRGAVKAAFKRNTTQSVRQNRAMASIANHILTSSPGRYSRKKGTDEYFVLNRDHFMLAACGHTQELASMITKRRSLLEDEDEHRRTLLYIACKSGFYDTCKMLLQKGAPVNRLQTDGSTPLHATAYYGHALVVGLLLEHGARSDIRNKWGSTSLDESATPEIRRLIQTASADSISSLAAKLMANQLVSSVRPIEYKGRVIAKELLRDPNAIDAYTRAEWDNIQRTWESTWHGTRYKYLESIIEKGLVPAGSNGIKPPKGHYSLGEQHFGIRNWAAAIFLSPSILYAAHACYSDRVFSESEQWCVLVRAFCKPRSYKSYNPTVYKYEPIDGEPDMLEYRVPVTEADKNVILRVESTRSVVVRSLMFVRLSFLESQDIDFEKAVKLFL